MSDSNARDRLDAKHEQNRRRRLQAVKRWAEYVKSEPVAKWGPQQNAIVDDQLAAAESVETSAAHRQRVASVASEIVAARDDTDADSE